jgi:hypothetical protein
VTIKIFSQVSAIEETMLNRMERIERRVGITEE